MGHAPSELVAAITSKMLVVGVIKLSTRADVRELLDRHLPSEFKDRARWPAGYRPDTAPRDAEWGERFFHLTDPDGHELSFAMSSVSVRPRLS
jgi:hypothetical protein